MKILFVLENYYPKIGGVETLFKHLVDALVEQGYECVVITSWPGGGVPKKEQSPGLRVIRISTLNRYFFTLFSFITVLRYTSWCDLVHTTSYNAALPAFLATRFVRRRIIITFHEVWGKLWFQLPLIGRVSQWGHYWFEQLLLKLRFDQFIAVSQSTASKLKQSGVAADRISVIYPGIDYDEFSVRARKDPAGPFTYTYFGRLGISKGLDILLAAAVRLKEELPNSRLRLIIPQRPRKMYRWVMGFIEKRGLTEYIELRHALPFDELKLAIATSDCVVIPSYSEGFCFVAAESIALGVPVISSDRAALKEVVGGRHLKMTILSARDLIDVIVRAQNDEWLESPVKRFELGRTVVEYINCYEQQTA